MKACHMLLGHRADCRACEFYQGPKSGTVSSRYLAGSRVYPEMMGALEKNPVWIEAGLKVSLHRCS